MKFKNEQLNNRHVIVINNSNPHLNKYTIASVLAVDDKHIKTNRFTIPRNNDEDIDVLEDVLFDRPGIGIGSEVTLQKSYNNFKSGQKIIIKDYLDEEKRKIITDGITPGGWIDISNVLVPIDYSLLRYKTLEECAFDLGPNWYNQNGAVTSKIFGLLGKDLDKNTTSNAYSFVYRNEYSIPGYLVTKKTREKKDYKVTFITEEEWNEHKPRYAISDFNNITKSFSKYFGVNLAGAKLSCPNTVEGILKYVYQGGNIVINGETTLYSEYLRMIV